MDRKQAYFEIETLRKLNSYRELNVAVVLTMEGAINNYLYTEDPQYNGELPYPRPSWWNSNNAAYRYLHKINKRGIILIHTDQGTVKSTKEWGNDKPGAVGGSFNATMNALIPNSHFQRLKAYMAPHGFAVYPAKTLLELMGVIFYRPVWKFTTFHIDQKFKDIVVDREDNVYLLDKQKTMRGYYEDKFKYMINMDLDSEINSLATEIYIVDTHTNRRVDSADGLYAQLEIYTRRYMNDNPITDKDRALIPKYSPL